MAKRANGEGSIRKRKDSKWLVTFPSGLYKANGKREYLYRYAATQAEAAEILRQLQAEKGMGVSQSKAAVKTGDWVEKWIEGKAKGQKPIKPSTLTSYRNNFRIHIKPYIGDIVLRELSTYHIQRCLDKIGKSCSTFVKNYNIIHGALDKAVELGMIARNPCKGVEFPEDDTEEMKVLSLAEQQRFIEQLEGEYYRPMFLMYLYSGLRMGEGIPLTWEDIDFDKQKIRVCKKAIVCHDYASHSAKQVVQDFCKTKSSKRHVKIPVGLVEVLKVHKAEMMEQAERLGKVWSESNLAFPNTKGNMVYSRNLQNTLTKIFAKCGIEGATMHTLRHSYATRCFEAKMPPKMISKQLGHQSVKTTLDIYVHVTEELEEEEIVKLDEINKLLA